MSYQLVDLALCQVTGLGPLEKLTLIALASHASEERTCFPSFERLMAVTALSRSSVIRSLQVLEQRGYITIAQSKTGRGHTNYYVLECEHWEDAERVSVGHPLLPERVSVGHSLSLEKVSHRHPLDEQKGVPQTQKGVPQTPPTINRSLIGHVNTKKRKNGSSSALPKGVPQTPFSEPEEKPTKKRASQVPDPFEVTEKLLEWARRRGIKATREALERETEVFVDHHKAKGLPYADWDAAWRTWMIRAFELGWSQPKAASNGRGSQAPARTVVTATPPGVQIPTTPRR